METNSQKNVDVSIFTKEIPIRKHSFSIVSTLTAKATLETDQRKSKITCI